MNSFETKYNWLINYVQIVRHGIRMNLHFSISLNDILNQKYHSNEKSSFNVIGKEFNFDYHWTIIFHLFINFMMERVVLPLLQKCFLLIEKFKSSISQKLSPLYGKECIYMYFSIYYYFISSIKIHWCYVKDPA